MGILFLLTIYTSMEVYTILEVVLILLALFLPNGRKERPLRQFPFVTFQYRIDSAIRYFSGIAGAFSRRCFFPFTVEGFLVEPHAMKLVKLNQLNYEAEGAERIETALAVSCQNFISSAVFLIFA